MPYLNAKEGFVSVLYYDGTTNNCTVDCRIADTKISIKRGSPRTVLQIIGELEYTKQALGGSIAAAAGLMAAGAGFKGFFEAIIKYLGIP
jgi:hypothetical protein